MYSTSNPASTRLNTETLTDDENGIKTYDEAESASDGSFPISELSENDACAPVNIFTDDILPEILDNLEILTAQDLLNFRLVNRCWRDSATWVLLKRNLCQIVLNYAKVTTDNDGNAICKEDKDSDDECQNKRFSVAMLKYVRYKKPWMFLEDLNQLITTSSKFPSARIHFHSDCSSMILHLPSQRPYAVPYQADLLQFLSLYGMEMRELSIGYWISIETLQSLLYVHMPHLTCLDIDKLRVMYSQNETLDRNYQENSVQLRLSFPSTLRIKSISVGECPTFNDEKVQFLRDLISVCPNLKAIHCVGEAALEILIEMKKYHFIKELLFCPGFRQTQAREQVGKLVMETIFEKKLPNFQLSQYCAYLCHIQGYRFNWMAMNIILSASKDSLKRLRLGVRTSTKILNFFVPSLPYLEYLELNEFRHKKRPVGFQFKFVGDVIGQAIKSGELTTKKDVSDDDFKALGLGTQETNNIPADYFPRLLTVRLPEYHIKKDTKKLMGFFSLEHIGPDGVTTVPGDTVPTVTTLEFYTLPRDVGCVPKLFPNVSKLSFDCNSSKDVGNWVWTAFPKLERLEITSDNFDNNWDPETVDCFFTGISQKSRASCYGKAKFYKLRLETENKKEIERTWPYIGDCENLNKFEIKFRGKSGLDQFASAAVYGFQKVTHRTKIILSLLSDMDPEMSLENMIETLQELNPVTAYVEIRMNK